MATDLDDDPLTYSLDTAGESVFAIDSRSGQLRTEAELDHEATPSYAVTVTATDPSGDSDSIDVTITVADIDEPLTLTGPSTVPYEENDTATVATFSADDPEQERIALGRWRELTAPPSKTSISAAASCASFARPPTTRRTTATA